MVRKIVTAGLALALGLYMRPTLDSFMAGVSDSMVLDLALKRGYNHALMRYHEENFEEVPDPVLRTRLAALSPINRSEIEAFERDFKRRYGRAPVDQGPLPFFPESCEGANCWTLVSEMESYNH